MKPALTLVAMEGRTKYLESRVFFQFFQFLSNDANLLVHYCCQ